ncbi:hypothetical protein ACTXM1_28365, partial [Pseudomonas helleri]|uniref:hypothetical protein n=1 Tax=Pseudomonas helleri TaxID=1608996 RepID=UPI003FD3BEDF
RSPEAVPLHYLLAKHFPRCRRVARTSRRQVLQLLDWRWQERLLEAVAFRYPLSTFLLSRVVAPLGGRKVLPAQVR